MPYKDPEKNRQARQRYAASDKGRTAARKAQSKFNTTAKAKAKYDRWYASRGRDVRRAYRWTSTGWSPERVRAFAYAQNSACLICFDFSESLVADHCHQTKQPRALLCHQCNRTLGLVSDDPEILTALIAYLQFWTSRVDEYLPTIRQSWPNDRKTQAHIGKLSSRCWSIERFISFNYAQSGVCAVCKTGDGTNRLHADHSHETNSPRALLCNNCNVALGQVADSINVLQSMIEYLKFWSRT